MIKVFSKLITAAVLVGVTNLASAALIWDNGSGTSNTGGGYCGSCGAVDAYTMFDNFSLSTSLGSASLEWDAAFGNFLSPTGAVRVGVWSNYNSGQLWSQLFNYSDLTLVSNNGGSNKTVSTLLSGLNLSAGNYWLSLSGENMYFNTSGSGTSGQVWSGNLGNGGNPQNVTELGFRLYGASSNVPEPSAIILFALGLVGLTLVRRNKAA